MQDHETRFKALYRIATEQEYIGGDDGESWHGQNNVALFRITWHNQAPVAIQVVGTRTVFYRDRIETTETGPEDW